MSFKAHTQKARGEQDVDATLIFYKTETKPMARHKSKTSLSKALRHGQVHEHTRHKNTTIKITNWNSNAVANDSLNTNQGPPVDSKAPSGADVTYNM